MSLLSRVARRVFRRQPAKETASDLGFGVVPDPGLANQNWFRQWVGIYQLMDRLARARGGNQVERPIDERMLYIARGLMRYNSYAQGFITALRTHTLGSRGFQVRAIGKSARVLQPWLDWWMKEVDWWSWEREIYERVHVEGDSVTRFFPTDGCVLLRPIEMEWIIPKDGTVQWSFGFFNEPGDVHDVTALYELTDEAGEVVDHNEWYHIKSKMSVRADKRGRSDFLATASILDDSFKTWRNWTQAEAVRAAIVYFSKQPEGVTADDLDQAIAAEADYTPASSDGRRGSAPIKMVQGVGVEYLPAGNELVGAPGTEVQSTISGVNAALLAVGRAYQMPVVLLTGDMAANNTVDFSDETPFGKEIGDEQHWYSRHVRNLLMRVVECACDEGYLPEDLYRDGTDLLVEAERKPGKDVGANTQRAKTLQDDGIISKRTRATLEGVDYDEEQEQIAKEKALEPPPPSDGGGQDVFESADLVEKSITVHRGGKTFTEKRKVRPGGAKAINGMARKEKDETAKDYLESAMHNAHADDPDDIAQQLADMYLMAHAKGHDKAADALNAAMHHVGAELTGPEHGARMEFDPGQYKAMDAAFTGDTVYVLRKPVMLHGKVLIKGLVTTKEVANEEVGGIFS